MTITTKTIYEFSEEEQQALNTVYQILHTIWPTISDNRERAKYFEAFCVVNELTFNNK